MGKVGPKSKAKRIGLAEQHGKYQYTTPRGPVSGRTRTGAAPPLLPPTPAVHIPFARNNRGRYARPAGRIPPPSATRCPRRCRSRPALVPQARQIPRVPKQNGFRCRVPAEDQSRIRRDAPAGSNYILYRPRSSSLRPSSQRRSSSLFTFSETEAILEDLSTDSST